MPKPEWYNDIVHGEYIEGDELVEWVPGVFMNLSAGARAIEEGKKLRKSSDRRVCICGHGARSHTSESVPGYNSVHDSYRESGRFACLPGKIMCPCQKFEHVLDVDDVRRWVFKTEGPYKQHALQKGISGALEAHKKAELQISWECFFCGKKDHTVGVVGFNKATGRVSYAPSEINKLTCGECFMKAERGTLFSK